jgi:single-strand DNA-binding protein
MPKGINKVTLLGNVGKDPEIRATQGGTTIANFSFATAERRKDGDNWVDHTEWHNLVAFQRTAEIVRDYVKKGSQLFIEGKLQQQSWEDKQSGEKKYKTVIVINDLVLLGSPENRENGNGTSQSTTYTNGKKGSGENSSGYGRRSEDYGDLGITDNDVPF